VLLCYAQITSIPDRSGESPSDIYGSGNNDDSSDSSSDPDDDGSSDSSDTVDSSDGDEQTNDLTMSEVDTNPLSDTIIKNVIDELTTVGITDLGF
jgi:hypothetical protein